MADFSPRDPITQDDVERELLRFIDALDACNTEVAVAGREAAVKRVAYKVAKAKAMLTAVGTVPVKDALAEVATEDQRLESELADAREVAAREMTRNLRAQIDAIRSVAANVRTLVG